MRGNGQVVFWVVVLVVAVATVALLGNVLLPFVAGAVIAYFLNPLADLLERTGMGRLAASALIVALATVAMLLALIFLVPLAAGQLGQLAKSLPGDLERIRLAIEAWAEQHLGPRFPSIRDGIEQALSEFARGSSGIVGQLAQVLWKHGLALVNLVSLLLVTPIVAFYLLRDWNPLLQRIDGWLPRRQAAVIRGIATDIDTAVGAFIRGQGTICLILGVIYSVALSLAGLKYGLVIGIATGLMAFVPMVGWLAGFAMAIVAAFSQAWPDTSLLLTVAAIYLGVMALDAAVLSPAIVGQRIGLHPVWLIFALFVFSALFGFVGTLVAVPVAAAAAVLVRFARDRYLESTIYLGDAPAATPGAESRHPEA